MGIKTFSSSFRPSPHYREELSHRTSVFASSHFSCTQHDICHLLWVGFGTHLIRQELNVHTLEIIWVFIWWVRKQEGGEQTPAPSSLPPPPAVLLGPDLHLMGAVLPQPEARQVLPTVGSSLGRSMTFTTSVSSAGLLRWSIIRSLL